MTEEKETTVQRGRPRKDDVQQAILKAALALVFEMGFRALSIEAIAARTGVGKPTIYRRWPNKAAVVRDAFLTMVGPQASFPRTERAVESIQLQMRAQAKVFSSEFGTLIKALLGEAQFDPELAEAFRERWILPRRRLARETIEEAIRQGDLREDIDPEIVIDLLYAPVYYRLQIQTGPIDEAFVDGILEHVMAGLRISSP
jgi:AcrR family transcriptional regulator